MLRFSMGGPPTSRKIGLDEIPKKRSHRSGLQQGTTGNDRRQISGELGFGRQFRSAIACMTIHSPEARKRVVEKRSFPGGLDARRPTAKEARLLRVTKRARLRRLALSVSLRHRKWHKALGLSLRHEAQYGACRLPGGFCRWMQPPA